MINGYFVVKDKPKVSRFAVFTFFKNHKNKTTFMFVIIITFGFFLRLYDSLFRKDYSNLDAYIHYNMSISTLNGNTSVVFNSYNRGFHLIVIGIYWLSDISVYDCIRFIGPILCSISILSVYIFVKNIKGVKPALFAALLYGCVTFGNTFLRRQTISLSEAPVFFLIPLALLFAFYIANDVKNKNLNFKNIVGFALPTFLVALIHPISAMYFQYILIAFLLIAISKYAVNKLLKLQDHKMKIIKKNAFTAFILILIIMPVTVYGYSKFSKEKTGSTYIFEVETGEGLITNSDLLGESGALKNLFNDIFSFNDRHNFKNEVSLLYYYVVIFITIISFLSIFYFFKNDFFTSFLATSVFIWGFILLTGFGEPSMYSYRSSVYFIMFALIFCGVVLEKMIWKISQILKKIPIFKEYFVGDYKKLVNFSFVMLFIFLIIAAPFFTWGYTHLGYEDNVNATLDIKDEYPMKEVTVYSGNFGGNREGKIVKGNGGNYNNLNKLLNYSPKNLSNLDNRNLTIFNCGKQIFIFLEKKPYPLSIEDFEQVAYSDQIKDIEKDIKNREDITKKAEIWIGEYKKYHSNIEIYYETDNIIVYLIKKCDN